MKRFKAYSDGKVDSGARVRFYQLSNGDRISTHSSRNCLIDWGMELHDLSRRSAAELLKAERATFNSR